MYSFQVKADTIADLANKLILTGHAFRDGMLNVAIAPTHLSPPADPDFNQTTFPFSPATTPVEEKSAISAADIRAELTTPIKVRKKRTPSSPKSTPVGTSEVEATTGQISTPVVAPALNGILPLREQLTVDLNAFLEHANGGVPKAREMFQKFGAAKMSDLSDAQIPLFTTALNSALTGV